MKKLSLAIVAAATVAAASPASAAVVISNTGAVTGTNSAGQTIDTKWNASGSGYNSAALVVGNPGGVGWTANNAQSSWVSITPSGNSSTAPTTVNGNYTYSTSFTASAGDVLNFLYWADDVVLSMTVDGVTTAVNAGTYTGNGTAGSFAVVGGTAGQTRSLSFTVQNNGTPAAGNPTGFRFQQVAAVPEPATWGMMVLGFGAVGFAARRRSKVAGRVVAA